jgi:hypothetical protein
METRRYLLCCAATVIFGSLFSCAVYDEKDKPPRGGSQLPQGNTSPFRPTTVSQCTKIAEVSFFIQRGDNSCIQNLTWHENTACADKGEVVEPVMTVDENRLFIGPLEGNNLCPETVTVRKGSPCYLVEFDSGGVVYRNCYHGNRRINCSLLGPPASGICATHP